RERGVVDVAVRCGGDAVGAAPAWSVPHLHGAGRGIETAVDAILAGEPDAPALVEGCGVEVHVATRLGQRPPLDLAGGGIDAHDRVGPALGDPGRAGGPDDHAVRGRGRPKWDQVDLAAGRVEATELPGPLG